MISHLDRMTEHPTRSSYQDVLQIYPLQLMNAIPQTSQQSMTTSINRNGHLPGSLLWTSVRMCWPQPLGMQMHVFSSVILDGAFIVDW